MLFVARRIIFALSAVYLVDFLWAQLAIQTYVSIGMLVYLNTCKPLESLLAQNMEILNELTAIVLTYGLLCFTDFVPSEETRS